MSNTYPSYENLQAGRTLPSLSREFLRLRWSLKSDSLPESIAILHNATDPNSPEEPYSPAHPIRQSSLTQSPVSSIKVSIELLNDYAHDWRWAHQPHADPDEPPEDCDGVHLDDEGRVLRCCNQDRPGAGPQLEVVAEPGGFVSIGLFVEAVHPWLRELDGELRAAKGVVVCWPLDSAVEIFVRPTRVSELWVDDVQGWTENSSAFYWKGVARTAARLE